MESFFVIPFTIGLIFLIISLTASYIRWFMALRIKNKVRLKKALSIKWLVVSLVEVFRECLLHIRIFKVNKRLWYMHMIRKGPFLSFPCKQHLGGPGQATDLYEF